MAVPLILAACFIGVFCLAPLAVYLLWLAAVNRRGRPAVVSGGGDFTALLVGLSGFLLAGAVIFLTLAQTEFRAWTRGNFVQIRDNWGREQRAWLNTLAAYSSVVVLAVGWSASDRRRKSLVVYNVLPSVADDAIETALAGAGRSPTRFGNRWTDSNGKLVAVRSFHAMNQVTVRILTRDPRIAEEIGRQLRTAFAASPSAGGSIGAWVSSAAWSCGLAAVCCFGLLIFYVYLASGR